MKYVLLTLTTLLVMGIGLSYASDMAFHTGDVTECYSQATMLDDVDEIKGAVEGLFKEVVVFNDDEFDDLKAWAEANLDDGELDIIWIHGVMPSVLYPLGGQPDGSLAERWLDNGNMFIDVSLVTSFLIFAKTLHINSAIGGKHNETRNCFKHLCGVAYNSFSFGLCKRDISQ